MKKWFLLAALVCGFTALHARSEDHNEDDTESNYYSSYECSYGDGYTDATLCFKANLPSLDMRELYFLLSDGSYWRITAFIPRWKNLSEWWNSQQIVPDSFECNPKEWPLDSIIQVYAKEEYMQNIENDASNLVELENCTHLLVNTTTGEMVFATALESVDSLGTLAYYTYDRAYVYGRGRPGLYPSASYLDYAYNAGAALSLMAFPPDDQDLTKELTEKATFLNADGYFVLADGSCWKVVGFAKRWRTICEWWNNTTLIPESYESIPNDWVLGTEVTIYPKAEYISVNEDDATNSHELKNCPYLLVNQTTGKILFALPLEGTDCMERVLKAALHNGFYNGWHKIDANQSGSLPWAGN